MCDLVAEVVDRDRRPLAEFTDLGSDGFAGRPHGGLPVDDDSAVSIDRFHRGVVAIV